MSAAALRDLLESEHAHAGALRELLDEEHRHLGAGGDVEAFARVVAAKHERVAQLERCALEHARLLEHERPPTGERPEVAGLEERLREMLEQCRALNDRNAGAAELLGRFNARLLRVLSGEPATGQLYGPRGASAPVEPGWSRYSASA